MTLHDSLIARAPVGVSEHDSPGAFAAIVAKRPDGKARIYWQGKNDHPRVKAATFTMAEQFANHSPQEGTL